MLILMEEKLIYIVRKIKNKNMKYIDYGLEYLKK